MIRAKTLVLSLACSALLVSTGCVMGGYAEQAPAKPAGPISLTEITAFPTFTKSYLGETEAHVVFPIPPGRTGSTLKVWTWTPKLSDLRIQNPPKDNEPRTYSIDGAPTFVDLIKMIPSTAQRFTVKMELMRADGTKETSFQVFRVHDLDGSEER